MRASNQRAALWTIASVILNVLATLFGQFSTILQGLVVVILIVILSGLVVLYGEPLENAIRRAVFGDPANRNESHPT